MNADFYDGALGREGDSYFPDCHGCPILNSYTLGIVFESPNYSAEKRQEPCYNWLFEDVVDIRGYYKRAGTVALSGMGGPSLRWKRRCARRRIDASTAVGRHTVVNVTPFSSLASISNTCQRFVCSNIVNDFTYRIDLMITEAPVGSILVASIDAIVFG